MWGHIHISHNVVSNFFPLFEYSNIHCQLMKYEAHLYVWGDLQIFHVTGLMLLWVLSPLACRGIWKGISYYDIPGNSMRQRASANFLGYIGKVKDVSMLWIVYQMWILDKECSLFPGLIIYLVWKDFLTVLSTYIYAIG